MAFSDPASSEQRCARGRCRHGRKETGHLRFRLQPRKLAQQRGRGTAYPWRHGLSRAGGRMLSRVGAGAEVAGARVSLGARAAQLLLRAGRAAIIVAGGRGGHGGPRREQPEKAEQPEGSFREAVHHKATITQSGWRSKGFAWCASFTVCCDKRTCSTRCAPACARLPHR